MVSESYLWFDDDNKMLTIMCSNFHDNIEDCKLFQHPLTVFKISAGPRTLTGKIWVGPASFPSLSYIPVNFGEIVLRSGKFQILFWRLP